MQVLRKMTLALGVVALMAAPAWAQGRGGFGGRGGALLSNKSVQKELKVDDAQASKLDAYATEIQAKQREEFQKLQDVPQDERREKMQELQRTMNADMLKGLADILKPEQVKRFTQIQRQQAGPNAFATPHVAETLKLTDDQKSKVREINDELGRSMREAFQDSSGDREAAMKKVLDLRKQANDKVHALLTDDQKATWKEMTGAPFEVKYEPRPQN